MILTNNIDDIDFKLGGIITAIIMGVMIMETIILIIIITIIVMMKIITTTIIIMIMATKITKLIKIKVMIIIQMEIIIV